MQKKFIRNSAQLGVLAIMLEGNINSLLPLVFIHFFIPSWVKVNALLCIMVRVFRFCRRNCLSDKV